MIRVQDGGHQTDHESSQPREEDDPVGGGGLLLQYHLAGHVVARPGGCPYQPEYRPQRVGLLQQVRVVGGRQGGVGEADVLLVSEVGGHLLVRVSEEESRSDHAGEAEVEKDPAHHLVQPQALAQHQPAEDHRRQRRGEDYSRGVP